MKIIFGAFAILFSFSVHASITTEDGFTVMRECNFKGDIQITAPTQIICGHGSLIFASGTHLKNPQGFPLSISGSDMKPIQMGDESGDAGVIIEVAAPPANEDYVLVDRTLVSITGFAIVGHWEVHQPNDDYNRRYLGIIKVHLNANTGATKKFEVASTTILDETYSPILASK